MPPSQTPGVLDALIGSLDLSGPLGSSNHHFLRQALGYQFIGMVLADEAPVRFGNVNIGGIRFDAENEVGIVQGPPPGGRPGFRLGAPPSGLGMYPRGKGF